MIEDFCKCQFASFALFRRTIVLKDWKLLPTMSTKFTCGWVIVLAFFAFFHCSNATQPFLRLACHEEMFLLVVRSPVQSAKRIIKMSHASACWHFCIPSVSNCKQPQSVPNFKGSTLIAFAFTCKHPYSCIQYLYCHCVLLGTTFDACPHLTFQSKDPEAPNSKTLLKAQNTEAFLWITDAGINAP